MERPSSLIVVTIRELPGGGFVPSGFSGRKVFSEERFRIDDVTRILQSLYFVVLVNMDLTQTLNSTVMRTQDLLQILG